MKSKALEMTIKEDLRDVWKAYCRSDQIGQIARTRDGHMNLIQKLAASSMWFIGSLMTTIHENRHTGMEIIDILEPLKDAGNLLALLMHKQSLNRRAFIEPGMSKESQEIAKNSRIEDFLFGNDLTDKIKDSKAHTKEGQELFKVQQTSVPNSKPSNYKAPYKNHPRGGMGSFQPRGRPRQRFSFRGRQQFVNHRAQAPPHRQQRPPPPYPPRQAPPRDR